MSTIHHLPEEILRRIFDNLENDDLRACQEVCRSWYSPAHIKSLHHIELDSWTSKVEKFIAMIDYNPDPKYLKAVKSISIKSLDRNAAQYTQVDLNKLFFRFPNLEKVYAIDSSVLFRNFNEQMCKTFLTSCPKLKCIVTDPFIARGSVQLCHQLYKLRDIVTVLPDHWGQSTERAGYGTLLEYVTMFPRLREIRGYLDGFLKSFENALFLLKNLSNLEAIWIRTDVEQKDHAEQYLQEAPQEESDLLLQRLAKIKQFKSTSGHGFSVDSMNFALKYLVGLESVKLDLSGTEDWLEVQHEQFCNTLLELVLSCKKDSSVHVESIDNHILHKCIDSIMEKVYINNRTKSALTIHVEPTEYSLLSFDVITTNRMRAIKVCEEEPSSSVIRSSSQLSLVQVFKLEIAALKQYPGVINIRTYSNLIQGMKALEDLVLDVPTAYDDFYDPSCFEIPYMHVESLTIQTTPRASYQALLDQCCSAFPNLMYLKLFYSCGIWNDGAGNFQINLKDYTLDKLAVDMTALKAKQEASMQKFFVIDIDGQQMYKIQYNISSFTTLKDGDLKDFTNGKDYLTVKISIRSLQRLELLMYCDVEEEEYRQEIDSEDDEHDLYLNYEHLITRLTIHIE